MELLCEATVAVLRNVRVFTGIAEIFVRVKISYSSVCQLSYARNFRTATVVSDTHAYVYGFRMLLNFVLSAKSTKYTKLNRVRKFVRLQYVLWPQSPTSTNMACHLVSIPTCAWIASCCSRLDHAEKKPIAMVQVPTFHIVLSI